MSINKQLLPKAATLMGSLRSMGYSFESAVADVIDNSISAHASVVQILFPDNPLSTLAVGILDDGDGMSDDELLEAMRYGSIASEEERAEDDLGRFGMGLKSASLSQCRRLTVISKDGQDLHGYRWDYSYIIEQQDWIIQELTRSEIDSVPYIERFLTQQRGTMVVWDDFDVLSKSSGGQVYDTLVELRSSLEASLALIFHRYLSSNDSSKLEIFIDNLSISPLDPFLEKHPKTTSKKEKSIAIPDSNGCERQILIKPFILPFATDLKEKDKRLVGGIENLRAKQGFYVYRNKRLIIWGTWFGMNKRAELTKNARIRVDIPNSLDDIWAIDIKKQNASIPKKILNQLKKTVMEALDISVHQQNYRGRTNNVNDSIDYIWERKEGRNDTYFYQINRDSKLFQYVREKISEEDIIYLDMLLTEIEKNIPIQQMYIDKSNEAIAIEDTNSRLDDVFQMAISMAHTLRTIRKESTEIIIDDLMKSEPFCYYPKLKDLLKNNLKDEFNG
jgi:hypothetical protein